DTLSMNPIADGDAIAQAYTDDPVVAATEYGALWRSDLEQYVSREVVLAATVPGRVGLPPIARVHYAGFCDPSGGSQDSFTLGVPHAEQRSASEVVILDYVAERRPPFSPDDVVREYAETLREYGIRTVQADRYAGQWVVEAFGKHRIHCEQPAEPKSTIYGNVLPLLNSRRGGLLAHARLQAHHRALERRAGGGRGDTIVHPPGAHDDLANAACGALALAVGSRPSLEGPMAVGLASRPYQPVDWVNLERRPSPASAVQHDPKKGIFWGVPIPPEELVDEEEGS